MRKRSGRPPRHAAVPNETIDDALALDFMALALLTVLLRHRDGWEITLAKIGEKYGYGRDALANAMGLLQVARYVVKIRMMSVQGNQWSTEVYVFDTPATDEEVAVLLAEAARLPEVRRASVIEPTAAAIAYAKKRQQKLAPKHGRTAPTMPVPRVPENPDSGATSGNGASSQAVPECGFSRQSGDPAVNKKTVGKKTIEETDAPSGRSPMGARSAETSGSRGLGKSGFAAPATSQPRLSKQDRDQVQAVRALLPQELNQALGDRIPPNVSAAIVTALAAGQPRERSPRQLVAHRVERRWNTYWASRWFAEGLAARPYGPLVAMVKDTAECGNLACDDRVDIHTEQPCSACATRAQDRRAAREADQPQPAAPVQEPAVPGPRQHMPMPECDCGNPLSKDGSLAACWECRDRQEAEAAGAALAAQWAADEAHAAERDAAAARLIEELEQEDVERAARMQAQAEEQAAVEAERQRLAAEEDARLRAEFAAQHPELAGYGNPAPF